MTKYSKIWVNDRQSGWRWRLRLRLLQSYSLDRFEQVERSKTVFLTRNETRRWNLKTALTLGFVRFSIVSFGLKAVRCLVSEHFLRFSPEKKTLILICFFFSYLLVRNITRGWKMTDLLMILKIWEMSKTLSTRFGAFVRSFTCNKNQIGLRKHTIRNYCLNQLIKTKQV